MEYEEKCKKSVSSGINAVRIVNTNKQLKNTCLTMGSWVRVRVVMGDYIHLRNWNNVSLLHLLSMLCAF